MEKESNIDILKNPEKAKRVVIINGKKATELTKVLIDTINKGDNDKVQNIIENILDYLEKYNDISLVYTPGLDLSPIKLMIESDLLNDKNKIRLYKIIKENANDNKIKMYDIPLYYMIRFGGNEFHEYIKNDIIKRLKNNEDIEEIEDELLYELVLNSDQKIVISLINEIKKINENYISGQKIRGILREYFSIIGEGDFYDFISSFMPKISVKERKELKRIIKDLYRNYMHNRVFDNSNDALADIAIRIIRNEFNYNVNPILEAILNELKLNKNNERKIIDEFKNANIDEKTDIAKALFFAFVNKNSRPMLNKLLDINQDIRYKIKNFATLEMLREILLINDEEEIKAFSSNNMREIYKKIINNLCDKCDPNILEKLNDKTLEVLTNYYISYIRHVRLFYDTRPISLLSKLIEVYNKEGSNGIKEIKSKVVNVSRIENLEIKEYVYLSYDKNIEIKVDYDLIKSKLAHIKDNLQEKVNNSLSLLGFKNMNELRRSLKNDKEYYIKNKSKIDELFTYDRMLYFIFVLENNYFNEIENALKENNFNEFYSVIDKIKRKDIDNIYLYLINAIDDLIKQTKDNELKNELKKLQNKINSLDRINIKEVHARLGFDINDVILFGNYGSNGIGNCQHSLSLGYNYGIMNFFLSPYELIVVFKDSNNNILGFAQMHVFKVGNKLRDSERLSIIVENKAYTNIPAIEKQLAEMNKKFGKEIGKYLNMPVYIPDKNGNPSMVTVPEFYVDTYIDFLGRSVTDSIVAETRLKRIN